MLLIKMTFPAGRYHATPWGRHVNEGVPEWPPSPYRLVRALYDIWKRKRPDWNEQRLKQSLSALAASPPCFRLPRAAASHTRSYLSSNHHDVSKKQLIFDAFVVLHRNDGLLMGWPELEVPANWVSDLNELLGLLNFLGRSESWIKARILQHVNGVEWNCTPTEEEKSRQGWQIVPVACPIPATEYEAVPFQGRKKGESSQQNILSWMDAIGSSTKEVNDARISQPPAMIYVPFSRHAACFDVPPRLHMSSHPQELYGVKYALHSTVRPSVTETIEVADRFRSKIMGIHRRLVGDPQEVSQRFSGKDARARPMRGHRHIYILPFDENRDGWLDHLLVVCKEPLNNIELQALDQASTLWQPNGKPDLRLIPVQWGTQEDLAPPARLFTSVTPFIAPRHYRRGRGSFHEWLAAQVRREARNHGFPQPSCIRPMERLRTNNRRELRWIEFRRSRKGASAKLGFGFELEFDDPVAGPVALGYGSHFGLGLFLPIDGPART